MQNLSLVCHIKVQHADQWHHFVEVQDFKLPLGSFAAPLRPLNFVTLCPSKMYFLLYSTLKSVFVYRFGYPCTIDTLSKGRARILVVIVTGYVTCMGHG